MTTKPSLSCVGRTSSKIGLISHASAADAAPYTTIASTAPAMSARWARGVAEQPQEGVHQRVPEAGPRTRADAIACQRQACCTIVSRSAYRGRQPSASLDLVAGGVERGRIAGAARRRLPRHRRCRPRGDTASITARTECGVPVPTL